MASAFVLFKRFTELKTITFLAKAVGELTVIKNDSGKIKMDFPKGIKMAVLLFFGIILILVGGLSSLKWTLSEENYAARDFGDSIAFLLEEYKLKNGSYPKELLETWFVNKEVPELIDIKFFYLRTVIDGEGQFLLRFEDPNSTWADDGIFGYQSEDPKWYEL